MANAANCLGEGQKRPLRCRSGLFRVWFGVASLPDQAEGDGGRPRVGVRILVVAEGRGSGQTGAGTAELGVIEEVEKLALELELHFFGDSEIFLDGDVVWPENPIRRIPSSTKGYISVRNFGICESASAPETPRIKQETPKSWTRRIPLACQPFMTARLDRAGEAGHCWFILPATEISRKRNGSRHFDIGSSHYRRRQGLSPAVSDKSSFRAIRDVSTALGAEKSPCRNSDGAGPVQSFCVSTSVKLSFLEETPRWTAHNAS